ncbi:MAG: flagellar hook-length control protein FliK [Pseudomonadota bacterium]
MSEFNGPRSPGLFPGTGDGGLRSSRRELPVLQPGTRLQVRVIGMLAERGIQLQPLASATTGATNASAGSPRPAPILVAQLAGSIPEALTTATGRIADRPVMAEIVRTQPQLEVRLLAPDSARNPPGGAARGPTATPPGPAQWLALELRQQLPGARPLGTSLQALQSATTGASSGTPAGAAPGNTGPAGTLLDLLPPPAQLLQSDALRGRILQSGIWLEAMLGQIAHGAPPPAGNPSLDLKGQLLRAAEQLRVVPDPRGSSTPSGAGTTLPTGTATGLGGLIEGMIKRITTLQLQSLQATAGDEDGPVRWSFELPFRTHQGVESIIGQLQRERHNPTDPESHWSLVLKFDLQELGPVQIALGWVRQRLSVHFIAEDPGTAEQLRSETAWLQERLAARDLSVASMSVREGTVDPEPDPPATAPHGMLDERA